MQVIKSNTKCSCDSYFMACPILYAYSTTKLCINATIPTTNVSQFYATGCTGPINSAAKSFTASCLHSHIIHAQCIRDVFYVLHMQCYDLIPV